MNSATEILTLAIGREVEADKCFSSERPSGVLEVAAGPPARIVKGLDR